MIAAKVADVKHEFSEDGHEFIGKPWGIKVAPLPVEKGVFIYTATCVGGVTTILFLIISKTRTRLKLQLNMF